MGMMGQFLVVDPGSGIEEFQQTQWDLYPNPSNGSVTINSEKLIELRIYSILGKSVGTFNIQGKNTIELDLVPGVYFISDIHGNTMKFIIQ